MNTFAEMEKLIQDFYQSTDEIIKKAKSSGKDGKRGKNPAVHCSPSTVISRPLPKRTKKEWKKACEAYKTALEAQKYRESLLLPKIEKINMATYQGKRDTAIEIMVENKINEIIDWINQANEIINSKKE